MSEFSEFSDVGQAFVDSPFALPSLEEVSRQIKGSLSSRDSVELSLESENIENISRGEVIEELEEKSVASSESEVDSNVEGIVALGDLSYLIRQALEATEHLVEDEVEDDSFESASPFGVAKSSLAVVEIIDVAGEDAIASAVKASSDDWANRLLSLTGGELFDRDAYSVESTPFQLSETVADDESLLSSHEAEGSINKADTGEDINISRESEGSGRVSSKDDSSVAPLAYAILGKSKGNPWFDSEASSDVAGDESVNPVASGFGEHRFYAAGQLPSSRVLDREESEVASGFGVGTVGGVRAGGLSENVVPRSPFEHLFVDEQESAVAGGLSVGASSPRKRGRPAGSKNRALSPEAIAKVAKAKNTELRGKSLSPELRAKAKRIAKKNAEDSDHTIDGIRLTPRDHLILIFLARYRVATIAQLARVFGTSQTALRNRLPRLERAGLLDWAWGAATKPKLWLITEAGLDTVGMDLNAPTVKWGQLRHTLGLVDLGIAFEEAEEVVLTEREIRAAATRHLPTARMKSAIGPAFLDPSISYEDRAMMIEGVVRESLILPIPGRAFGHIPDMVLVRQPYPNGASGNVSIELELTRKSISEWKTILTQYRDSYIFAEVYYFVLSKELKNSLNSVIKSIHAEDKIRVFDFKPVDLAADPYVSGGGSSLIED